MSVDFKLAVHSWWHSWNHYGMFGLSSEHSTLYCVARDGYVPLDAKEMYLKSVFNYNPVEFRSDLDAMLKAEKAWADSQIMEDLI